MHNQHYRNLIVYILLLTFTACGDDEEEKTESCELDEPESCEDGLVCEEVQGSDPTCVSPVVIRGRVFDITDGSGIDGARIVALDINGSARSTVAVSGSDGNYELVVPMRRNAQGEPLQDEAVTLNVAASRYQSFPTPPRESLPIDLAPEADDEETPIEWVIANAATEVGLVALPGNFSATNTITGTIDHELGSGALVVAVQDNVAVSTAIADAAGEFTLFNVPDGEVRVEAYRAGLRVEPQTFTTATGEDAEAITLTADTEGLSSVKGSVNIVNAEGGLTTSVILVLESTFKQDAAQARGIAPAGLRVADISNAFTIEDVPPGEYAVLAAFENDFLVRDPDSSIAGTDVVHITVDGEDVDIADSFKITEALAVQSPGADGVEVIAAGQAPEFIWADDSSEDGYELRVYDALGELVHEALELPRVTGDSTVSYTWSDADLDLGGIYQFRVLSYRDDRKAATGRVYISATEDLRGVFQYGEAE